MVELYTIQTTLKIEDENFQPSKGNRNNFFYVTDSMELLPAVMRWGKLVSKLSLVLKHYCYPHDG